MPDEKNEIIVYQPDETIRLEVRLENETVWLTQSQMVQLFRRDQSVIARHISNIFLDGEVEMESNMHFLHIPFSDRPVAIYSLDIIISVGYRIKSIIGTRFRQWATRILRDKLLASSTQNCRLMNIEDHLMQHAQRIDALEKNVGFFLKTSLPPVEGVLFEGQICDAYATAMKLIKSAKKSLVLIDNYIDESVLTMLGARDDGVSATIYTRKYTAKLRLDVQKYNAQYPPIMLKPCHGVHDRFLLIDDMVTYHIGASLKDLGKSLFAFSRLEIPPSELLSHL
ncbi:MAG: virulence RhuM family protein [Victivallales bacterium]|nr:virulence RhuM family protein [Victivallales bacterium]